MSRPGRPEIPYEIRRELWTRWKNGESLMDIGTALNKHRSVVLRVLCRGGGIYQPPRQRSRQSLTLKEREEISRGIASGFSIRQIARCIGRAPSTVSREIARNKGRCRYRAIDADDAAWDRARRPKPCKLALNRVLQRITEKKLIHNWSPEQISGWLKRAFPDDESMHVSHETIYRSLFIQSRGVLKKELMKHLRSKRILRHGKNYSPKGKPYGQIVDAISISERPPAIEDRAIPGHWEGDLIAGSQNSHIATLVERATRFTMLVKLAGKDAHTVADVLTKHIRKLPEELRRSLTWDRGSEMAQHKRLTIAADIDIYFCDPQSPWQRGTNENTNRLLRQYLPKQTDLSIHSQTELNRIARELNQRPRKTLEYATPAEKMEQVLR